MTFNERSKEVFPAFLSKKGTKLRYYGKKKIFLFLYLLVDEKRQRKLKIAWLC